MAGVKGRSGGANRKPREVLVAQGTLRPDRHGDEGAELEVSRERPPAPPSLAGHAVKVWGEILDDLETMGILADSDAGSIESLALAMGRARDVRSRLNTAMRGKDVDLIVKLFRIESAALSQARPLLHSLGLSPSARAALGMHLTRAQRGAKTAAPETPAGGELGPSPRLRLAGGSGS